MNEVTELLPIERRVADIIASQRVPGDLVEHADLDRLLDITWPDRDMNREEYMEFSMLRLQRIEGWRNEMLSQHGLHVVSIRGKGYRISKPDEVPRAVIGKVAGTVLREVRRAQDILRSTERRIVDNDARLESRTAQAQLGSLGAMASRRALLRGKK